jgi:hypothetical protein
MIAKPYFFFGVLISVVFLSCSDNVQQSSDQTKFDTVIVKKTDTIIMKDPVTGETVTKHITYKDTAVVKIKGK